VGFFELDIPEIMPFLLGLLGCLLAWQLHDLSVRAGRIRAVDFWNRSGIRMFLQLTPEDGSTCNQCRQQSGQAYLPAVVAAKEFTRPEHNCQNPTGCRCQLVGLYGAWPTALTLRHRLKKNGGRFRLTPEQVDKLISTSKLGARGATIVDHISLALLEGMRAETKNPEMAIDHYAYLLTHATDERDRAFVVPTYLRLSDLLERNGRRGEALKIVDRFFKEFAEEKKRKRGQPWPTEHQFEVMSIRKTRLTKVVAG